MFFSVIPGGTAIDVLEDFSKVAVRDKAAALCDRGNTLIRSLQPHGCHLGTVFNEKADGGTADGTLKAPGAFTRADSGRAGDFFQPQGLAVVCIDVLEHEFHAFQIPFVSLFFCNADLFCFFEQEDKKTADDLADSELKALRFIAQSICQLQDQLDHTDPEGSVGPDPENG